MGYIYAFLSSIFFTLYAIPKKFVRLKPVYYVLFMGISSLLLSIIFYIILANEETLFNKNLFLSFIGGICWFIASVLFFYSIDKIGVARSTELKSLQGPIGSIMILTILSEYTNLNIYLLILAITFILLASLMLIVKYNDDKKIKIIFLLLPLLSAVFYALSAFIKKVVTIEGFIYSQQIYSSLAIVISSVIYILISDKKLMIKKEDTKKYLFPLLSGMFYYFASFLMLLSYKHIEGSITYSIIQLNAIWAGIIGIFVFKEIDYRKYSKNLILALLFALGGIILLLLC